VINSANYGHLTV